jgi:dTDP-4-dehydrorhamnose 3,5-epimerase
MKKNIFNDIKEINLDSYIDHRGHIYTSYNEKTFKQLYGISLNFNHDKILINTKHSLRGLHGDYKSYKLVTCCYGDVYYVLVDNRQESPTYLKWDWELLTHNNKKSLLIPPGFASSCLTLSDTSVLSYKWSYEGEYTDADQQFTLKWHDKKLNIHWPIKNPIISERDI